MSKVFAFVLLAISIGLFGCEDVQALKADETRQKLVGSWLREMERGGDKGRRLLVLRPDGKFEETLVVYFADGRKGQETKAGEWSFDGINLKRKYTHEDGRQLSGNFNFATFALTSFTGKEFEGRNHAQGEEIRYARVAEGTQP
jgi:hypothetical protein